MKCRAMNISAKHYDNFGSSRRWRIEQKKGESRGEARIDRGYHIHAPRGPHPKKLPSSRQRSVTASTYLSVGCSTFTMHTLVAIKSFTISLELRHRCSDVTTLTISSSRKGKSFEAVFFVA